MTNISGGAGAGGDAEGEHRRDDGKAGQQGGDGVQNGGHDRVVDDVLRLLHIAAVDQHACAVDGQGEEGLSHGHDPGLKLAQVAPVGGEQVEVALPGAGEEGHADGDDEEENKEGGHHELADLLDTVLHAHQQYRSGENHGDKVPGNGAEVHGHGVKIGLGLVGEHCTGERTHRVFQHPAYHHRVADGDTQYAQQGQNADDGAALFSPLFQHVIKGARRARSGETAQAKLARQAYIAEQGHKDKVGHQESAAAILSNSIGEQPDISHAYRGAHGGQNKTG